MSLSNGRQYLAIPGPSVVPDRVLQAMHQASPNIYTGPFPEMLPGIVKDLKNVARTRHKVAMYIANGHGAWEAALSNTLQRGDKVLLLASGIFAHGWGEVATRLGVKVQLMDFGKSGAVDPARVSDALKRDTSHEIKAVMVCHVDTSTSVLNDIAGLRAAIDAARHPALLMVDCIASLACDRFEMDDWGVDVMVAGSQKGLMTPPEMAFVYFNEKADALRGANSTTSWYWDWRPRADPGEYYQYFGGTAPTQHLFGLREALDMIAQEGLAAIWQRHDALARAYWAAFEVWGQTGPVVLNIADAASRSRAVTSVAIGAAYGTRLRNWLSENTGVTLGIGLGMGMPDDPDGDGYFRVGHMGHINSHMVLGTIGAIEAGLLALDIDHGAGALDAAAAICASG